MKTNTNTNWSSPKTNILAGLQCLRSALAAGQNAELIRMRNEDCAFPILQKEDPEKVDFRGYRLNIAYQSTYNKILNETSPWNKHLSLHYKTVYGTQEAVEKYYSTGELSSDNFKGTGRSHLVKVTDMIAYLKTLPVSDKWAHERAASLHAQYCDPSTHDMPFFYDFYTKQHGNEWTVKKFKHKLWVVNLLDEKEPRAKAPLALRILNVLHQPLYTIMKYFPKKDVLNMKDYKNVTFRVGGITNGFSVQIQIPKKFSFK